MALVITAALLMALIFLLFKIFDRRELPLFPVIVVNYVVAFVCGVAIAPPWLAGDLRPLLVPSLLLGVLFILVFYITGLSTQRAGVAATTVASKMSLVLTVLFAVIVHGERPDALEWSGIVLALVGVALASYVKGPVGARGVWMLPLVLFLGSAAIDISLNTTQRLLLTRATEAVFPTMVLGVAGLLGGTRMVLGSDRRVLLNPQVLLAGAILGTVNYASLYFILAALARSGFPASSTFPLMNIGVILFGTAASMLLFKERLLRLQWIGIAAAVLALVLIMHAHS
jgi:drug/metabolite transporter (DMT)-like permease